jgi:hypothetical protein
MTILVVGDHFIPAECYIDPVSVPSTGRVRRPSSMRLNR